MAFQSTIIHLLIIGVTVANALHVPESQPQIQLQAKSNPGAPEIFKYLRATDEQFECGSENMLFQGTFSAWDYAVVVGMLVISIGIGIFYGFFQKSSSSEDFLLGSNMSLFPVALSLTTSFITAIELLGNPAEMFYNGTQFSLIVISIAMVLPVAIKVFYPIYFKMQVTSCYEYLGVRFGKEVRILGAILYIIQMSFYTSVAVLAPAIALSSATGLSTRLAIVLIFVVCVFYSSQGGMKAVVIADTFQASVLAFSLILILALGYYFTGNVGTVFQTAADNDRLEFFNIDPNPTTRHSVWSVVIGGFFYWTSLLCTNQASVQKALSLRKRKTANWAIFYAIIGLVTVFLINFYTGLMTFTHYVECDPLKSGQISAMDQLLPFYVMDVFGHITSITGIFVAGIFAASLGTVAAALNSLSAVTCEDLLISGLNIKITPEKGAYYAKWMSLGYGLFSFGLIFIVEQMGGILQATLTLNGLIGGVTLGLFVLGIGFKCANTKGALYGGILSLLLVIYVGIMSQIQNSETSFLPTKVDGCDCYMNNSTTNSYSGEIDMRNEKESSSSSSFIYNISYMWFTFFGMAVTIIFSLIISVIVNLINKHTSKQSVDSTAETQTPTSRRSGTAPPLTAYGDGYENGGFENKLEKHKTNGTLSSYGMKNENNNEKSSVFTMSNDTENNIFADNDRNFERNLRGVDNAALKMDDCENEKNI